MYRKKEAFSDGVSSVKDSWHTALRAHADAECASEDGNGFATKPELWGKRYPWNTPRTAEELWYRRLFDVHYGHLYERTLPHFWGPRWTVETTDPSARELRAYEDDE